MIVDSVTIDPSKIRTAPGGGILIEGRIGRSGVQEYRTGDARTVRVLRPREEVEAADFEGSPLTVGHPPGGVTPATYQRLTVGTARSRSRTDTLRGQIYPVYHLQVNDQATIEKVQSGELSELSCCYRAQRIATPGTTEDGESYDLVFRGLQPNHIALGPAGFARAGRDARLLVADGESAEELLMSDLLVADSGAAPAPAGTVPPSDRDALVAQVATLTAELSAAKAVADSAATELSAAKAERDAAQAELAKLDAKIADGVAAAVAFRDSARKVLGMDFAFDDKTDDEVKAAVRDAKITRIKELDSEFAADGVDDTYLDAYLAAASKLTKPTDHNRPPPGSNGGSVEDGDLDIQAHIRAVSAKAFRGE